MFAVWADTWDQQFLTLKKKKKSLCNSCTLLKRKSWWLTFHHQNTSKMYSDDTINQRKKKPKKERRTKNQSSRTDSSSTTRRRTLVYLRLWRPWEHRKCFFYDQLLVAFSSRSQTGRAACTLSQIKLQRCRSFNNKNLAVIKPSTPPAPQKTPELLSTSAAQPQRH